MATGLSPKDDRLVAGLRGVLAELGRRFSDEESQQSLGSANALLDELTLRLDRRYYADYVLRGADLLNGFPPTLRDTLSAETLQAIEKLVSGIAGGADDMDVLGEAIESLRRAFEQIVSQSAADSEPEFLARLLGWETELYSRTARFQAPPQTGNGGITGELTRERLENYLRVHFADRPNLRLTEFTPLIGGFQKLTVVFAIEDSVAGKQSLVLRGEQPDNFVRADLGEIPEEYRVVRLLFEAGLPIPEPMWLETDASLLGRRFMVSRKASGTNCGSMIGASATLSREAARALVSTLARIHLLPLGPLEAGISETRLDRWLHSESLAENTRHCVRHWRDLVNESDHNASPSFSLICRWLIENAPDFEAPLSLVHCDFGPHNVLAEGDEVTGVVDWELVRLGDPAQDVAYFLNCTEGQLEERDVLAWYREAGGAPIDDYRLRYWQVHSTFQMMGGCFATTALYADNPNARNVWATLALKWKSIPLDLAQQRIAAAMAASPSRR